MARIKKRTAGIYQILCLVNNKIYVGSSKDIGHRFSMHRYDLRHNRHSNSYLQRCWNKYGEESFQFTILELTLDLQGRESFYIQSLQSFNRRFGFNIQIEPFRGPSLSGCKNGMYGKTHTEDARRKISIAAQKRTGSLNPNFGNGDAIRGDKNPFYGRKHSEETKRKISESQKKRLGII